MSASAPPARARFVARASVHAAFGLLALSVCAAQELAPRPALEFLGERALENDTFLPVSAAAETSLAKGDRAWLARDTGQRDAAFDAWHAALAESASGDAVRAALALDAAHPEGVLADPAQLRARCVTGVELAVAERLALAGDDAQRAWTRRFDALAARALAESARDPRAWRAVEREHPRTAAAARAALLLADDAYEHGDAARARGWLARARAHRTQVPEGAAEFDTACARRAAVFDAAAAARDTGAQTSSELDTATALAPVAILAPTHVALLAPTRTGSSAPAPSETSVRARERTRVLNGACSAGENAFWIQTPELGLRVVDGRETARVELAPLCAHAGLALAPVFADRACDWPLVPASDGARVFLVLGRSSTSGDNALACVDGAELAWAWTRAGRTPPEDGGPAWFGPGRVEFQPGPVVSGATVFAQVRFWPAQHDADGPARDPDSNPDAEDGVDAGGWSAALDAGRIETYVCAFRARDGALLWSRFLARGALTESAQDRANLGIRVLPSPAAPLALGAAGLAVETALGTLSLVDPLDGRLVWTLRTARARGVERSNPRAAPAFDGERIVWRPADGPELAAFGPLASGDRVGASWSLASARLATLRLDPASAWLGGAPERCVCTCAEGAGWEELAAGASPSRSLDPGRRDPPLAFGRVTPRRALGVSETGLWLLDRTRELAVLDRRPLAAGDAGPVWVAGEFVAVLGEARVQLFRATAAPHDRR